MKNVILIRFSEIFLKGKNRGFFEKALFANIKDGLKKYNLELPLTAKIDNDLKSIGVDVKTDYKIDNIIEKIAKKYNG